MDERAALATLQRRMAFGFGPGEWDAAVARGAAVTVDALIDPDAASVAAPADPWDAARIGDGRAARPVIVYLVDAWLTRMVTTPRPLVEWMAWFWHGHFVSAFPKLKEPLYAVTQLRLFQESGLGSFPALLRAVTVDPAMLVYLDGRSSSGRAPNENYGREMIELFSLGVGNYTELDVEAAARALTGWVARTPKDGPADGAATFSARRHDDSPQHFLGRDGVHDVDTVVDAVCAHPACATFVAGKLARAALGPRVDDATIAGLAATFSARGLDIRALTRAVVDAIVAGVDGGPVVLAPVPWLVMAQKATGAHLDASVRVAGLRDAGQVPTMAPNVSGWPSGDAWYSSASVVARFNLASVIADNAPPGNPAVVAAESGDLDALAAALGVTAFAAATAGALHKVEDRSSRLVLALTAPEFVTA
jgi:uncharacterized protein (DUF1800 family)